MNEENERINDILRQQNEAKRRALDFQSRSKFTEAKPPAPAPSNAAQQNESRLAPSLITEDEKERMFLLSLCFLLSGEGADEALLVALLYLMS